MREWDRYWLWMLGVEMVIGVQLSAYIVAMR